MITSASPKQPQSVTGFFMAIQSVSGKKKAIKRNVPFHFKFDGMPMGIISIFSVEIYTIRIVGYLGIAAKNDISLNQIYGMTA